MPVGIFKSPGIRPKQVPFQSNCFNSSPYNPDFQRPWRRRPQKTLWEKEKMLVTSIFSISQNVFYPFKNKCQFLSQIYFVVCMCFQFWQGKDFVVWWKVKQSGQCRWTIEGHILCHLILVKIGCNGNFTLYQTTIFWTGPNSKYLQTTK